MVDGHSSFDLLHQSADHLLYSRHSFRTSVHYICQACEQSVIISSLLNKAHYFLGCSLGTLLCYLMTKPQLSSLS